MRNLRVGTFFKSLLIILTAWTTLRAQQAPGIEWQKCLGGTDDDYANCIIQTSDGGYTIAGETFSNDGDVIYNHGGFDGWVVKLDSYGDTLWQKSLGGSLYDGLYSIIQTSDGGYAAAGWTNSNDGDVSGHHGFTNGTMDAWIIKLDSLGNIQWQKCLGGTGDEGAYSIIEVSDEGKGYVIAGYTNSTDGDVSGKHGDIKGGPYDAWVVRLSSSGAIEWQKCLGGSSEEIALSVIQTSDRGFVIAGYTGSIDGDIEGYHGGAADGWIVKLNSSGSILWQKCLGGSGREYIEKIILTSDGGFALAGQTDSNDKDISGNHGLVDVWIIKLNSSGDILWKKCFGGTNYDVAITITQTSDNGYVFAGWTKSHDGDISGYHGSMGPSNQIWVVKLNPSGNIIWQKCLGGTCDDWAFSIVETTDKGYAIAGRTCSNDGDVSGYHVSGIIPRYDAWVVKLNPEVNSAGKLSAAENNFAYVYPNPSLNRIQFQLPPLFSVNKVQFFNLLGMQYYPDYRIENTIADVDVHNLPAGSYVMRVSFLNSDIEEVRKFLHYH